MNNALIIGIYSPFAIISTFILIIELLRRFKRPDDYLFLLLCLCAVGWFATNITGLLTSNPKTVKYCINFALIFAGSMPPISLLFTLRFYKVQYRPSNVILALLFAVPAIDVVLAITSGSHTIMTAQLDVIILAPLREVSLVWGSWFWVHTAYIHITSITLISVILSQHFRLPRFYRTPSSLIVTGVFFTLVSNVAVLLKLLPQAMDPTPIIVSFSLILFDVALINNNKSKFARFSHSKLYHYLNLYILILDKSHRVTDYNRPAFEWFSCREITLRTSSIEDITEALLRKKGHKKVLRKEGGTDYYINDGDFPMVLNLCMHELTDVKGDVIGFIAVFTDVTENRMLIERLEKKAGMDSLTGLANHMAYDGAKRRLDSSENLPLSVIMCDTNELKIINDKLGHQYGDMLLRIVAEVLERVCPKRSFVARIGGDEFIYLLPHTDRSASCMLMDKIRDMLSRLENLPFSVSVALGAATKFSAEENLDDLIALADKHMYEDKRRAKKQPKDLFPGHKGISTMNPNQLREIRHFAEKRRAYLPDEVKTIY